MPPQQYISWGDLGWVARKRIFKFGGGMKALKKDEVAAEGR